MEKSIQQNVCSTLQAPFSNRVTIYEQRERYLLNFLNNVLPSSDISGIKDELKKSFTFVKHKAKTIKKKPQKTPFLTVRKSILLGLNKFGKKDLEYTDMLPLNSMWLSYMQQMLGVDNFRKLPTNPIDSRWDSINQKLIKADYHGAIATVTRSRCPSTIGIQGIIIQDTKNTLRLLSSDNVIRTIPKESSVFCIHLVNNVKFQVFGKELCIRPAERSVKKFKNLSVPEL
ncbi:ribonuclease P protein subunit p29 [Copidosoma floridanum]|uniref:ribonuclease P protein subunit p29 n=1 Tax=Copidosoma floridanum TaxID=29053 RepID=UPI0006C99B9E|nr:ribonuclease P protein subunit p29 [Copidosoma floridanum]XP_023246661.1 ribonuclease P protein subunit p29 [Copidosoma floridanum]XP_023246662.1 ribonuclease P protein subunit p29 [Copidosoma floridanum]XP_023246663.1 ribonuclease P protein subunit p29 [Copidosoma floridanum]